MTKFNSWKYFSLIAMLGVAAIGCRSMKLPWQNNASSLTAQAEESSVQEDAGYPSGAPAKGSDSKTAAMTAGFQQAQMQPDQSGQHVGQPTNSLVQTNRYTQSSVPASPSGMPGQAATSAPTSKGTQLVVSGVVPNSGPVRVAVFENPQGFPAHESATKKLAMESDGVALSSHLDVASQTFAVAAYQDLNNDGVLNRSSFGIPSEPYAFSGNSGGQMGPPSFQQAAVAVAPTVQLRLKQFGQ